VAGVWAQGFCELSVAKIESDANTLAGHVAVAKAMKRYDLSHSFASQLAAEGRSLFEIKELLGHQNIASPHRYAHLRPSHLHTTVELLDD
jgi:site-specific recombinase XerD